MINEHVKVIDTHESVLDVFEILKVEMNDNIQSFNTVA